MLVGFILGCITTVVFLAYKDLIPVAYRSFKDWVAKQRGE